MSENAKTIVFVVAGLLAVSIGIYSRPTSAELDPTSQVGTDLTKNFDSADKAKHLRIVRFNEDTATLREFEVAEQGGLWSIPSKNGYPADAARQMAEAATSLMDRKILEVVSSNSGDHAEFGVMDPRSSKLEVGQKGVGTRVTMSDVNDSMLVDLIIGKAVKGSEGQRYVREAGREIVYVIEIDPSKLSTNFEDWIEKDLLKLNAWDLQQVQIKDYSAELTPLMTQQGLDFQLAAGGSDLTLAYNDTDSKWAAGRLRKFDTTANSYTDFTLAEDEELNSESLNGLKTALDDLQIVDVARKPQGLSNDLKAGEEFLKNREAVQDLVSKGFIPGRLPGETSGGGGEIISGDGEVIATMKNGTEYVLRFGNLTNVASDGQSSGGEAAAADKSEDKTAQDGDVHRYMFVMARFNESAVKRPDLKELPELPADEPDTATEAKPEGEAAAPADSTEQPAETTEGGPRADPAAASSADEAANAAGDKDAADIDVPKNGEASDQADDDVAKTTDETEPAKEAKADESATTEDVAKNEEAAKSDEAATTEDTAAEADSEKTKKLKELVAERERIEQENKRKEDEYKQNVEKGREAVKDLNLRFGDWYFVVADDVFKKIRLGREAVVKKKEAKPAGEAGAAPGTTPGAIRGLPTIPGISQ